MTCFHRVFLLTTLTLALTAGPASAMPDLIATASNDAGGSVDLGQSFVWSVVIENIGTTAAAVSNGNSFLADAIPLTDIQYTLPR